MNYNVNQKGESMERLKLGLIVGFQPDIFKVFEKVKSLGIPTCQLSLCAEEAIEKLNPAEVKRCAEEYKVEISCVFVGFKGQIFNLKDGPETVGFIPPQHRERRISLAKEISDMVKEMGVDYLASHVGFIPDDEEEPLYKSFLPDMKDFLTHCKKNNQIFCFETGQELPSTLKRTIEDLKMENTGINLDPANLILYGKANPLDAVEIFGKYVKGMHAKDGIWPDKGEVLGKEVPLGEGMVNFPLLLRRLKKLGYKRPVTIEREIGGEEQIRDVKKGIKFLEPFL